MTTDKVLAQLADWLAGSAWAAPRCAVGTVPLIRDVARPWAYVAWVVNTDLHPPGDRRVAVQFTAGALTRRCATAGGPTNRARFAYFLAMRARLARAAALASVLSFNGAFDLEREAFEVAL